MAALGAVQLDKQATVLAVLRNVAGAIGALTSAAGPAVLIPPLLRCAGSVDASVAADATACLCDVAAAGGAAACAILSKHSAAVVVAAALRSKHAPLLLQSLLLLQALVADEGVRGQVRGYL